MASLTGKWDSHLHFVLGDLSSAHTPKEEREMMASAQLLWKKAPDSPHPCKYTFSPFCITLNEITPGLEVRLHCREEAQHQLGSSCARSWRAAGMGGCLPGCTPVPSSSVQSWACAQS